MEHQDKPALLISACLLGQPVRYDAQSKPILRVQLETLQQGYRLIPACPECLGGLPTPRPAAEILGGDGQAVWQGRASVVTGSGEDVSAAFTTGAQATLHIARQHGCSKALLKANSPSCGKNRIYDGHFHKQLQPGSGVTASLLQEHGLEVWDEDDFPTWNPAD